MYGDSSSEGMPALSSPRYIEKNVDASDEDENIVESGAKEIEEDKEAENNEENSEVSQVKE